ncbi:MAG: hypothetical protein WA790_02800 [Sulfitobacter sp.]
MLELLLALSLMAIGALALKKRNAMRLRADQVMLDAVDDMYQHLNTLIDAKVTFDGDVPDEIMDLAEFMVKCARTRNIEFSLAASLSERADEKTNKSSRMNSKMREPLQEVFEDLVHAWFKYVSHKNLLARHVIRASIGRMAVLEDDFHPFNAQIIRKVAKRNVVCPPNAAAA